MTDSHATVLIVIRGNSGSGKSTIAAQLRARYGRGIALVAQDNLRRTILRERDTPGAAAIGLIDLTARYALDNGFHVVVEGILDAGRYADMLTTLAADHRGRSHFFYLDVDFPETVRRHATRPEAAEVTPEDMAGWYQRLDLLPEGIEHVIPQHSTLAESVRLILDTTAITPPGRRPVP
jgi:predicted kinase